MNHNLNVSSMPKPNTKTVAGLWIDHRKAVIATVAGEKEETTEIQSNVEKQPGRIDGVRSTSTYEAHHAQADDIRERELTAHLNGYYAKVIAALGDEGSIVIFGPGEAKGELKKRLVHAGLGGRVAAVEATDKMTVPQIVAKVRDYFRL